VDVWHRVVKDFDYNLDAPCEVSDKAMDALLTYLGIEIEESPNDYDWWATRIDAAAATDPARLLAALSMKDLRRIAAFMLCYCADPGPLGHLEVDDEPTRLALHMAAGVHEGWSATGDDLARFGRALGTLVGSRPFSPDMIPALMVCTGAPGETLAELPWAEPGWSTPLDEVDHLLYRAPELHVEWFLAMAAQQPDHTPRLADSAARTGNTTLVEPYGIALLAHGDAKVRLAAVNRLSRQWRTDAYQDAVAALLTDPELADAAADKLAELADRRCLPRHIERVEHAFASVRSGGWRVDGRGAVYPFGTELLPHVLRKLAEPLPPWAATRLLLAAATWGDPPLLLRPEAADVVARLRHDPDAEAALIEICLRVSWSKRMSEEMRAQFQLLATESPIRVRQHAEAALLANGE
jgi:hypothetical protein